MCPNKYIKKIYIYIYISFQKCLNIFVRVTMQFRYKLQRSRVVKRNWTIRGCRSVNFDGKRKGYRRDDRIGTSGHRHPKLLRWERASAVPRLTKPIRFHWFAVCLLSIANVRMHCKSFIDHEHSASPIGLPISPMSVRNHRSSNTRKY